MNSLVDTDSAFMSYWSYRNYHSLTCKLCSSQHPSCNYKLRFIPLGASKHRSAWKAKQIWLARREQLSRSCSRSLGLNHQPCDSWTTQCTSFYCIWVIKPEYNGYSDILSMQSINKYATNPSWAVWWRGRWQAVNMGIFPISSICLIWHEHDMKWDEQTATTTVTVIVWETCQSNPSPPNKPLFWGEVSQKFATHSFRWRTGLDTF